MVCRHCQHAVHPKEVYTHLRQKHRLKNVDIQPIAQAIEQWQDLIQDPAAVHIPHMLENPLPGLPVHTNGMLCQRDPSHCQYLVTHINTMRKHWQQAHGWTQHPHRGHVPAEVKAQGERELQQSFRQVAWQQVFPTRKNSHLVHIQSYDAQAEPPTPAPGRAQIAAEIKARAADDEQQAARQSADSETLHDANPWLRMTRWARYLAGVHFPDLIDVVTPPDPDDADPVSQASWRVWDAMMQLARRSQRTVQHCGNGIRMAAVSTMPNQTP
ncbi:hypothetical protein BDV09DRAFT_171724 [Aspergillus tetrazonus]